MEDRRGRFINPHPARQPDTEQTARHGHPAEPVEILQLPDGSLVTIQPPMPEVTPIARSRAQPLRLMNAPRRDEGTASVMMAWPGTNRPLANTKNAPPEISTAQTGSRPECVMNNVTTDATATRPEKTRKRPNLSASFPMSGAVNTVSTPPVK